ncbi:MAG: SUMF1/EgtB/PvdO family nonheme iron enzyme [Deltaproteobacteria bacterium]|nr:SUMF1/EgtB/PvdO family nonheme iron enzyme [Deltaproteobacteria bacterium]
MLLESQPIEGAVPGILAFIGASNADRVLIACDPSRFGNLRSAGERLEVLDFSQLFRLLCAVPDGLPALVFGKARRDFNQSKYQTRFQDRLLRVVHTPDGGGTPPQSEISAGEYFKDWARADLKRHPVLLLGERGSGKTWQLFRFCEQIFSCHQRAPWLYGPAFFFDLREERAHLGAFGTSVPFFPDAVLREYPTARFLWDARLVEAFIAAGHMTLCIDGFEEVGHITRGDEGDAIELLQRICSALPLGARFITACRATHFGSIDRLLAAEVWPSVSVSSAFEIVALLPFGRKSVSAYLSVVAAEQESAEAAQRLGKFLKPAAGPEPAGANPCTEALLEAVKICSRSPALLAAMVDHAARSATDPRPAELLAAALVGAVVDYNIQLGKARDLYTRSTGAVIRVGTNERVELLGELVWHLAARGTELVSMDGIPAHISHRYGLDVEAVRTDLQTHTLLEVAPLGTRHGRMRETNLELAGNEDPESVAALRFAVRPNDSEASQFFPQVGEEAVEAIDEGSERGEDTTRARALVATAHFIAPAGATSVSGAFLLARHVAVNLKRAVQVPLPNEDQKSSPVIDRLRALGDVPLGLAAAGILRDLLADIDLGPAGRGPQALADLARRKLVDCAARRDLSVFSSCLRFLGHNLDAMGLLSGAERAAIDPWWGRDVEAIIRGPNRLERYEMVLMPPPVAEAAPSFLAESQVGMPPELNRPFLIGEREITNEDYLAFLSSKEGNGWRVENVTIAGGARPNSRPRFAKFTNEYHLYFWEEMPSALDPRHRPLATQYRHPVVYVSWYACAAFCDWLTQCEPSLACVYPRYFAEDTEPAASDARDDYSAFGGGYRLPAVHEWSWAARGGRLDVSYPWELYPLILPESDLDRWCATLQSGASEPASDSLWQWLMSWRSVYKEVLLGMAKEHVPVLSEPFGPFGTSGMMGNVKEWCHDFPGRSHGRRAILGATSYLGERSFAFDYGIGLFPQNTNPDVGFRLCRSLSDAELTALTRRETEIANFRDGFGTLATKRKERAK